MLPILNRMLTQVRWLAQDLNAPDALVQVDKLESRLAGAFLMDEQAEIVREIGQLTDALREQLKHQE